MHQHIKKFQGLLAMVAITSLPFVARAEVFVGSSSSSPNWASIKDLIQAILGFINGQVIPVFVILAILFFFWNIIRFLMNTENEKEREQFRKYSINTIIAIFIMFSLWGIIGIATTTFFGTNPFIPQLPTQ